MSILSLSKSSKPSSIDVPFPSSSDVLVSKDKEIADLKADIKLLEERLSRAHGVINLRDSTFDFSQLWRDDEPSKLPLSNIIVGVLVFIVLIVVIIK